MPTGAPTVLVYGHYDVQPVDPLDLWTSPPFEPVVDGHRMLARGAADDKGQIHIHLDGRGRAPRDPRRLPGQRPVRLRGRGGVELGPPRRVARGQPGPAAADVAVISDTGFFEGNLPAITVGPARHHVRPDRRRSEARSTSTPAATAAPSRTRPIALARIITGLKGPDGRILIPGFYDDVVAADRRGPRGARGAAVRRGGASREPRASRRSSARRATRSSSVAAPARRSTSTGSGAGSRATAPRRSSRPTPTPRSAAGSSRTRIRTGSSSCSAATSRRSRRPA